MLASILRRRRDRRAARREARRNGIPHGSGWDRLEQDPRFNFMQRLQESPGGQPPRVPWRKQP